MKEDTSIKGLERESIESKELTGESASMKGAEKSGFCHHFSTTKTLLFILFLISLDMLLVFCLNSTLLYKVMFDPSKNEYIVSDIYLSMFLSMLTLRPIHCGILGYFTFNLSLKYLSLSFFPTVCIYYIRHL